MSAGDQVVESPVVELSMVVSRLWWKKSKFFFLQLLVETFLVW